MRIFRLLIGASFLGAAVAGGCIFVVQAGVFSPAADPISVPVPSAPKPLAAATGPKTFVDPAPATPDETPAPAAAPAVEAKVDSAPAVVAQAAAAPEYTQSIKQRPVAEAAPRQQIAQRATVAPPAPQRCLTAADMEDRDGDFTRNRATIEANAKDLCMNLDKFEEGNLQWTLQIIRKKSSTGEPLGRGPLWFVPHDDENAAFDTAIDSIVKYGGTIVAVESGGERLMQGQDPNRNFDAGDDRKCPLQLARSPEYTKRVMSYWRWQQDDQPIIALHSNRPTGNINITRKVPFSTNFRAANQIGGKNPDHTLVFVGSRDAPDADPNLRKFVKGMNEEGVNVIYETVHSKRSDCSLSNYASLMNIRHYLNVEVVTGDTAIQKEIVAVIMKQLAQGPIGPRSASAKAAPAAEEPADTEVKPKKKAKAAKKAPPDGVTR